MLFSSLPSDSLKDGARVPADSVLESLNSSSVQLVPLGSTVVRLPCKVIRQPVLPTKSVASTVPPPGQGLFCGGQGGSLGLHRSKGGVGALKDVASVDALVAVPDNGHLVMGAQGGAGEMD